MGRELQSASMAIEGCVGSKVRLMLNNQAEIGSHRSFVGLQADLVQEQCEVDVVSVRRLL